MAYFFAVTCVLTLYVCQLLLFLFLHLIRYISYFCSYLMYCLIRRVSAYHDVVAGHDNSQAKHTVLVLSLLIFPEAAGIAPALRPQRVGGPEGRPAP